MATKGEVARTPTAFLYGDVREAAEAIAAYDANVGFQYEISLRFNSERGIIGHDVRVKDPDGFGLGYLVQVEI